MTKTKVIFLDAVGTLFGVQGNVGKVYGKIAREFKVQAPSDAINEAFYQSFSQASPLAFPDTPLMELPEREYQWWYDIAKITMESVGVLDQFDDFDHFFNRLYGYFALPDAWFVYPDVKKMLYAWRENDIELGIISNFDTRIYALLDVFGLTSYFKTITLSSVSGVAKPNPKIFQVALRKHHCAPNQAMHVGDSVENDYKGAKAAGLRPYLLKRDPIVIPNPDD